MPRFYLCEEASRERTSGSRISVQKNFYTEQVWLTHEYYKWTLRTVKLAQCKCFIGRRYGGRTVKALQPLQKAICLREHNTKHFFPRSPIGREMCAPGMSHARALCTRVAQPWRAWSWRVRRQQWRRTVAPSELGRADRALLRSRTLYKKMNSICLGVNGLNAAVSPRPLPLEWTH